MNNIFTIENIQSCLFPVFKQYGVKRAILFGSYGKGSATLNSDVDLFDVTHVEKGSLIEKEIQTTGVLVYEE